MHVHLEAPRLDAQALEPLARAAPGTIDGASMSIAYGMRDLVTLVPRDKLGALLSALDDGVTDPRQAIHAFLGALHARTAQLQQRTPSIDEFLRQRARAGDRVAQNVIDYLSRGSGR